MMTSEEVFIMTKITFFRRLSMFLLFVGAFYSTVIAVSNLTITDVCSWMTHDKFDENVTYALSENRRVTWDSKDVMDKEHERMKNDVEKDFEIMMNLEQYSKKRVLATGYTAGVESTGKTEHHPEYGITFSGVEVRRDLYSTIAADLDVFPIGTILYVPDYGYGVVADKGSAITGNKIDLYYQTVEDVFTQWGKKEVEVYIIEVGEGQLTEEVIQTLNDNETLEVFRDQIMNDE